MVHAQQVPVRKEIAKFLETPAKQTKNADGSTTWQIEMGVTTAHTDVVGLAPSAMAVINAT